MQELEFFIRKSKLAIKRKINEEIWAVRHRMDWRDYESIVSGRKNIAPGLITKNPLLVVHPGFKLYCENENDRDFMNRFGGYEQYLNNLRANMQKAIAEGRSVLIYTPADKRMETLEAVGLTEEGIRDANIFLVPTIDSTVNLDHKLVGVRIGTFYKALSTCTGKLEVCGEFNSGCVHNLEASIREFAPDIQIRRIDDSIFPSFMGR